MADLLRQFMTGILILLTSFILPALFALGWQYGRHIARRQGWLVWDFPVFIVVQDGAAIRFPQESGREDAP